MFSRRRFLTGSAAAFLAACSSKKLATNPTTTGAASTTSGSPSTSAAPTTSPPASTTTTTAAPTSTTVPGGQLPANPFTLGVASGDPLPDSVILWTRLTVAPTDQPVPVLWEIAADDTFAKPIASAVVSAEPANAWTVHVDVKKLTPDTRYAYRFKAGSYTSPVGHTRTMPASGATPSSFVFAVASCQDFEMGYYAAYRDMAATKPDLVLFLGDYIYENAASTIDPANGVVRSHNTGRLVTLEDYRARYARYKSDPDLQAAHAAAPWLVIWDDHEVENNYATNASERDTPPAEFEKQRAAAYQAWWENMPTRLPKPTSANFQIYRSVEVGKLATLFMLDGRQYRSDQACGDKILSLEPPCAEVLEPKRTMLGDVQEKWLVDGMKATTTVWNVIGNQTIFTDATLNGSVLNFDQWDGYPVERDRITDAIAASGKTNTVIVTGDIHLAAVGQTVTKDGKPVASEFIGTSISSGGLLPDGSDAFFAQFPNVRYADGVHRGYTLHTMTPTEWKADYRIVADATKPDSTVSTAVTFKVKPDVPTPIKAA